MKINLEFDDNDLVYQMMDGMLVALLKNALREEKANYRSTDDAEMHEKNVAAYKHLIKYYSAPSEIDDD